MLQRFGVYKPLFLIQTASTMKPLSFTDTHCHLAEPVLRADASVVLQAAQAQGVRRLIVPATQRGDWPLVAAWAERPSENAVVYIALGVHPWFAEVVADEDWAELERLLRLYPQAWIGEIGLDFMYQQPSVARREQQIRVFERQLCLAERLKRRVIIHNLKATAALVEAVDNTAFRQGGIVHAFSGSLEEAALLMKRGFFIGIGSLLLNPNAKKARTAAARLPLERLVLETDSPFMLRDEVNTPANVRKIAEIMAELRGISVEEVARQTEANVEKLLAGAASL